MLVQVFKNVLPRSFGSKGGFTSSSPGPWARREYNIFILFFMCVYHSSIGSEEGIDLLLSVTTYVLSLRSEETLKSLYRSPKTFSPGTLVLMSLSVSVCLKESTTSLSCFLRTYVCHRYLGYT